MKKMMMMAAVVSIGCLAAQNPLEFLPQKDGMIVYKTYDAMNNLRTTTTYKVDSQYGGGATEDGVINMNYIVTNASGNMIDSGTTTARYADGVFSMRTSNDGCEAGMLSYLSGETQMMSTFLDYPGMSDEMNADDRFKMDAGSYTVFSKEDKKDFLRVEMDNREYLQNERVTVPAGQFDAAKIKFNTDVYTSKDDKTVNYQGMEWYAPDKGIVKTEMFDTAGNLVSYTVLAQMSK